MERRTRIVHFHRGNKVAVVTFDHWVKGKTNFTEPREAQWIAKKMADQIVVQTSTNDYYENDDFFRAIGEASFLNNYEVIRAIGFSMGCTGAIKLAQCLNLDSLFLVSPRLTEELERVLSTAKLQLPVGILYDPKVKRDMDAAQRVSDIAESLHFFAVKSSGHPASEFFRFTGCLREFLEYATSSPIGWDAIDRLIGVIAGASESELMD